MLLAFATLYALVLGVHRGTGPSAVGRYYLHKTFGSSSLSLRLFFLSLIPDLVAVFFFFLLGEFLLPRGLYLVACGILLILLGVWDESLLTRFVRHRNQPPVLHEIKTWRAAIFHDLLRPALLFDAFLAGAPLSILYHSSLILPLQPLIFLLLYLVTVGMTRFGSDLLRRRFRLVARKRRKRKESGSTLPTTEEKVFQLLILTRRLALLLVGICFIFAGAARYC